MTQETNIPEIKQLELELQNNPLDVSLMNQLAIAYLPHNEISYGKTLELLHRAFEISPSIKTANNYAYQLIAEWYECEKGIEVLLPFMDQKPKSYMPYALIGYAYLMIENYSNAESYLEKANSLSPTEKVEIIHNLGLSKSHLKKHSEAMALYEKSIEIMDSDNLSKYNKALCHIDLHQNKQVNKLINEIRKTEAYQDPTGDVSNLDLSLLSFLNNDLEQAYQLLMENDNFRYPFEPEVCYLLLKFNPSKYQELAAEEIESAANLIKDIKNPKSEDYANFSDQERATEIIELQEEIEKIKNTELELKNIPEVKTKESYRSIFCGCLFYDCKMHGTAFDDLSVNKNYIENQI